VGEVTVDATVHQRRPVPSPQYSRLRAALQAPRGAGRAVHWDGNVRASDGGHGKIPGATATAPRTCATRRDRQPAGRPARTMFAFITCSLHCSLLSRYAPRTFFFFWPVTGVCVFVFLAVSHGSHPTETVIFSYFLFNLRVR